MCHPISCSGVANELCDVRGGGDTPPLAVDSGAFHFQAPPTPPTPSPHWSASQRSRAAAAPSGTTDTGQCTRSGDNTTALKIIWAATLSYLRCKHPNLQLWATLKVARRRIFIVGFLKMETTVRQCAKYPSIFRGAGGVVPDCCSIPMEISL